MLNPNLQPRRQPKALMIGALNMKSLVRYAPDMAAGNTFCYVLPLQTGCLMIAWFDIIYGHAMTLLYLVSMYSGYFNVTGAYKYALWLDFMFTLVQLLGGVILVYGIKNEKKDLILASAVLGVVLLGTDLVGDALLGLTFHSEPLTVITPAALVLLGFMCMRGYMTSSVYCYFVEMKEELATRNTLYNTAPIVV